MGCAADAQADKEGEEDADNARWHVEECGVWGAESEGLDQSCRVGGYHPARDGLLDTVS